jgi:hypothetical protein
MLVRILAIALAWTALAGARADAPATTAPSEAIEQANLEDPLNAQSKCYLDLDTGTTYTHGEDSTDLEDSRRWIREHGIDLMCESREPANGLIAYDLRIIPATAGIDHPPQYAAMNRMFDKVDAEPFAFVSPGQDLPKSYLYRTSDGAMGVLEISAVNSKPSGLSLRYRRVVPPPKPKLPEIARTPFGQVSFPQLLLDREARLKSLRKTYGENHPLVLRARQDVELYKQLNHIAATEEDHELAGLKMREVSAEHALGNIRDFYEDDSPQVLAMKEQVKQLDKQIRELEASRRKAATRPATQPAPVAPVTQPFAKDFHL